MDRAVCGAGCDPRRAPGAGWKGGRPGGSGALALAGTLLISLLGSGTAAAQEDPAAADTIPLAPIQVTVLRTPFLTSDAPVSVSVLTERELRRGRSGMFLEEALQGLPGVQVQNRFNPAVGERVAIRGFGGRAQFGLRGIRVVVDGIPATLPDGQSSLDHLDIGSLGRVEAIRGPASSLFGNASGGVLFFTTRRPAPGTAEVEVDGAAGSHGLVRGQVSASGTVNGTGYLLTLSSQSWDGFRTVAEGSARADTVGESYGAADRMGLNARLIRTLGAGELSVTANVLDLDAENAGSIATDFRDEPDWSINDLYLRFRTRKELKQQQAGVRWAGPVGGSLEADVSAFGVHRTILNPIPFNVVDLSRNGGGVRALLGSELAAGSRTLEWKGGVEAEVQRDDRVETSAPFGAGRPAPGAAPSLDQAENVRSAAVFAQASVDLADRVTALAGLRYDHTRFEAEDRIPVSPTNPDDSGVRSMGAVSPSLGVSAEVGDGVNLFGSVSTVFETPTTSELSNQPTGRGGFNQELDPTKGESFEVGLRGAFGENVGFEVAAYQTNLRNELVPFEVPGAAGVTYFRNAGSSRHRGVELSLSLVDDRDLIRADATFTRTDARFREYSVGGDVLDDNQVPGLAPNRFQGIVRLTPEPGFIEVVGSWVDEVPVDDRNTASAPSYSLVDLRAGLDGVRLANLSLSPWAAVTNVLNEAYITSVAVNATGSRYFEPGPERSFQVGLRTRFGGGR